LNSSYILDINPLSDKWFINVLSHSVGCLFIFLMVSFAVQSFSVWHSLSWLFWLLLTFLGEGRILVQNFKANEITAYVVLRSFTISGLTFKSFSQFSSAAHLCPSLHNPMDCSTPGFPVQQQLWASSNSYPLSLWCHPTISSSVAPFSSCLQSFPASGSFSTSQLFTSGSQCTGAKASASVLPVNIQDWFPLGWTGLISLQSKGLSRVFSNTTVQKHQFLGAQLLFIVQLSHPYMTTGKTIALTRWTFVSKVISLLFNMLSRFLIAFLPSSKCLLISRLQSPSAVIFEPKKIKFVTVSIVSPSICHEVKMAE